MTTEEMVETAKRREADRVDLLDAVQEHLDSLITFDMDQMLSTLKLIQKEDQLLKEFVTSKRSLEALDHLNKASKILRVIEEFHIEKQEREINSQDEEDDDYPDYDAIEGYREMKVDLGESNYQL
tara:strand:- start:1334 stop:1708 length:375 start_codon:yes stop_codon:yes gene_type:complete